MIRAIFFDIDGTLISFKTHRMPESTKKALHLLRDKGLKLFIATGRSPQSVGFIRDYFDFDGVVSFNGQYCCTGDQVIFKKCIPQDTMASLVSYFTRTQTACCFEQEDKSWFNLINDRVHEMFKLLGDTVTRTAKEEDIRQALAEEIYQLTTFVAEDEEDLIFPYLKDCKILRWSPLFVNIILKDGGKPLGIRKMIEHYGFSQQEVMAFGDGGNDLDMLGYAGVGIAMGNALKEVREAADYVTADVDDDGIFKALQKFGLI